MNLYLIEYCLNSEISCKDALSCAWYSPVMAVNSDQRRFGHKTNHLVNIQIR